MFNRLDIKLLAKTVTLLAASLTMLVACGGGGGGSDTSADVKRDAHTNQMLLADQGQSTTDKIDTAVAEASLTSGDAPASVNQFGHNYGQALQRAWYFYEAQRSGPLPKHDGDLPFIDPRTGHQLHNGFLANRIPWRGDSGLIDGQDVGLDLTGGWHDAGDHVKFGLPMAFSASFTAWSVLEFREALAQSGQLKHAKDNLRWVADYFMRAHPEPNVLYGQVGAGAVDHSIWGPPEVMPHVRPAWKIDATQPGADLAAQTAAALAIMSQVFKEDEPAYAAAMLQHAIELYDFAQLAPESRYSNVITDAQGFYRSVSGPKDDIPFAAAWLYLATKEARFLHDAEAVYTRIADRAGHATWTAVWDDVRYAVYVVMAKIYADPDYARDSLIGSERRDGYFDYDLHARNFFNFWQHGVPRTPGGMAWLTSWGSARYNTMTSFLALVYRKHLVEQGMYPELQQQYLNFATEQVNYVLGDNPLGLSYMVGYGDHWVQVAHHRAAHGSSTNNINNPVLPRHVLYGGLAGGPDSQDGYTTSRSAFAMTEVATDMNAGITGALAGLVDAYGLAGNEPDANFPPPGPVYDEIFVLARLKTDSQIATEVEVKVVNESAYPPRESDGLYFRYFVDLSEVFASGYTIDDITLQEYWGQGEGVTLHQLADSSIFYVEGSFVGVNISPRGTVEKQKTSQFIIRLPWTGNGWDPSNDPSFAGLSSAWGISDKIAIYDDKLPAGEQLIWGVEPEPTEGTIPTVEMTARVKIDSQSGTGYCATVEVTNDSPIVAAPQGVMFRLNEDTVLASSWNGAVTRHGDLVDVVYPAWVEPIRPGATQTEFGFCATGLDEGQYVTAYLAGDLPTLPPLVLPEPEPTPEPGPTPMPEPEPTPSSELLVSANLYSVWASGYCARIVINNPTAQAQSLAGVVFRLAADVTMTQSWNGVVSRSGERVEVVFPSWMNTLAAGATQTNFGFCSSGTAAPSDLVAFAEGEAAPALPASAVPEVLAAVEPQIELEGSFNVYTSWASGYCARVVVSNIGAVNASVLGLEFTLPSATAITTSWNGTVSRSADQVNVSYPAWAHSLAAGATQSHFGYCASSTHVPPTVQVLH